MWLSIYICRVCEHMVKKYVLYIYSYVCVYKFLYY